MALYSYQAFTKAGKRVSGTVDTASLQGAREQVVRMGLFPIKIEPAAGYVIGGGAWWKQLFGKKVTLKDKIFFTKQLFVLLKAGVPLLEALELLAEQTEGRIRTIVIELKDSIKEGQSLADGLLRYPEVFDTTYVQLVRAGEASGSLELILERLTTYLERSAELRKRVRNALSLPLIQLTVVGIVVIVLLTFVVPQLAEVFAGENVELPLATRFLMGLSDFMVNNIIIFAIVVAVFIGMFLWWKSTDWGARAIDRIKLKLPIVGYFARMGAIVQFSRTLGMLMEGGVNLSEALKIVCVVVDNRILVDTLQEARENIIKQGKIADYLKQTNLFPPVAIYLMSTGEKSGQLDSMLLTVAQYYDAELQDYADNLSAKIGPVLLVFMGLVVGFVVYAIGKPLLSMGELAGLATIEV